MFDAYNLQDFADTNWYGDRFRALHDLALYPDAEKGKVDDYVDELNTEEANFVHSVMSKAAHYAYGSEENFNKALKAQRHAARIGSTVEQIRESKENPYGKKVLTDVAKIIGILLLTSLLGRMIESNSMDISPTFLNIVKYILIVLVAIKMPTNLLHFVRYKIAYTLATTAPDPDPNAYKPTFEECMAYFREQAQDPMSALSAENIADIVKMAVKQTWIAAACLPVVIIAFFSSAIISRFSAFSGAACGIGCLTLAFWRLIKAGKARKNAKDAVMSLHGSEATATELKRRQGTASFAFVLICVGYTIVTLFGVAIMSAMLATGA